MSVRSVLLALLGIFGFFGVVAYFTLAFFVVQPIGALPEGRTLLIARVGNLNFIDSADAICARELGGVSLLCRSMVIGRTLDDRSILLRLPYSKTLYLWSTGGREYDR